MTTLENRPNTALLVVDVQNNVVGSAYRRDDVIANINTLVDKARSEHVPVIWVQHADDELTEGSDGWQLVPELKVHADDPLIGKSYGDSFEATNLEATLAEHGVGRLIVTGAQSEACIRSTIHGALTRGYDTHLVSDAHTTEDMTEWGLPPADVVVNFTNMYWQFQRAPDGRRERSKRPTSASPLRRIGQRQTASPRSDSRAAPNWQTEPVIPDKLGLPVGQGGGRRNRAAGDRAAGQGGGLYASPIVRIILVSGASPVTTVVESAAAEP
ncbi:MAG: isochorismatase family protein [Acidimicrobiales bacterium]